MTATSTAKFPNHTGFFNRKTAWALLVLLVAVALAAIVIPAWIIQPFKRQTFDGMELAYMLRRWSPLVTLIALAGALALGVYLWRGARRWWGRAALAPFVLLALVACWVARQNHFEWMFKPLPEAAFVRADDASCVAADDMVMAVEVNGESVAYPIRQIAYHHVVQN